jgi:tetratricopeptide (TPR) repeat protein
MILGLSGRGVCQTFDVSGQSSSNPKQTGSAQTNSSGQTDNFSWGSGIQVARQARAAQDALKRNDFAGAVSYAQQAANSAPQNAELWFLLGYAARLDEKYPLSIDAFDRGLKLQPNSVRGLAGLAQTYAKMGRTQEAEKLLQKVVAANPKDANSLQLAGELMLNTDPQASLSLLQRAEAIQGTAHTDLLIAHAYSRMGQQDQSTKYLDKAKSRAPRDPEVLRAVAGQYRDEGKFDEAIATLQAISNKNVDTQAELAYTYQLAGQHQEAASLYSRVAKSAKGNIGLNLNAAQAWINAGHPEQAQEFLDAARRIDPNNYRLHAILGAEAQSEDRLSDSEQEYKLALRNLPASVPEGPLYPVELRLNLYEVYGREDDDAHAKEQLQAASAAIQQVKVTDEQRPEMLRLRAAVESASGNFDAANRDLKEALSLAPNNVNSLMNFGTLLWKMGQKDAARETFNKVLASDKNNRQALSALGYLARDAGNNKLAESFFQRAIAAHPKDYVSYLALGDLYSAERNFSAAQRNYEAAFQRMPTNPLIVSGATNAALESHNLNLAQRWLDRANAKMNTNPQVQRERERYLFFKGDYAESAKLGQNVLTKLPNDREGVVYLAYDLYYLGRYDEALALVTKYEPILKNDKDLPLIAGNVHAHHGELEPALKDFTLALERDPKMATGYVNRGFVLNDLKDPRKSSEDFKTALKLQPDYGEAHLGLAFADLQLRRPHRALRELDAAQKILGKSHAWHLARAEAYRQGQDYRRAVSEYEIALSQDPKDLSTELAYADVLYRMRRYPDALAALNTAQKLSPTDASVFALMAQVHAKQGDRQAVVRDVQSAEQYGGNRVEILTATGDAFLTLGDRNAAMQRFSRALEVPGGDRIKIRLAIAEIFIRQHDFDDARREIALGFAESRLFPDSPVTADDFTSAGNLFLSMHDFDLAENYYSKAQLAGANQRTVAIGLTNTYLAEGDTRKAEAALASLGPAKDYREDYDYMMASANLSRQRQDPLRSLAAYAQASTVAGAEDRGIAETSQYTEGEQAGRPVTENLSIVPEANFAPALEDINVYTLDAKILRVSNPALLPPPRRSYQSLAMSRFRAKLWNLPVLSGFVGESFTTGRLLFPSVGVVQPRNTYDTIVNGAINPILHLGSNSITFNGGLQFTVRRDKISPLNMNQDLFRQFLYVYTSSFFNWLSFTGTAQREAGPFTQQMLHSRDLFGNIEFTVGRPWGSTSLIAGYSARDLLFRPFVLEYFNTSTYAGIQHKFGTRLTVAALAEHLRSWRVQNTQYVTAQALLPGGRFDLRATRHWQVQGSFVLSRGMGYHFYDNAQSELLVSYTRGWRGSVKDGEIDVPVSFPMRFSVGVQQQSFYNFPGTPGVNRNTILPVVHFTLF